MNLKDKLWDLIESGNVTRAELSRATGIPYTTIDGILKRDSLNNVKLPTLQALAQYFNVSLDYLIIDEITDKKYGLNNGKIKTAPESEESESEAAVQQRTQILYKAFVDCGFIPAGGDLTDDQLRFCMGLADMLNIYFGAGK